MEYIMKKSLFVFVLIALLGLCSCGNTPSNSADTAEGDLIPHASCYAVFDYTSPNEMVLINRPKHVSTETGRKTDLEAIMSILCKTDLYAKNEDPNTEPVGIEEKALQAVADRIILSDNRLIIFGLNSIPESTLFPPGFDPGTVEYIIYVSKSIDMYGQDIPKDRIFDQWLITDDHGHWLYLGGGGYAGLIDAWWNINKQVRKN